MGVQLKKCPVLADCVNIVSFIRHSLTAVGLCIEGPTMSCSATHGPTCRAVYFDLKEQRLTNESHMQ